jgi:hypothetical protein
MARLLVVILVLVALPGCHRPPAPVELTEYAVTLAGADEYDALFDVCLDALREQGFQPDRLDRRQGVITTFPITSQQYFEFWRRDVATAYDLMEASLATIRRRVEIRFDGGAEAPDQKLVVTVQRERLSTPDRQYNSSAAAYRVFGRVLPSTTGKTIVPARDDVWVPLGRDEALERRLLDAITAKTFAGTWRSSPASEPAAADAPNLEISAREPR